jgi:hypothetical protein
MTPKQAAMPTRANEILVAFRKASSVKRMYLNIKTSMSILHYRTYH